jgi:hypothetical protein
MDRNQHGGGVIMLVINGILHDRINITGITHMETVYIMVHSAQGRRIQIVSGYNPPNREIKDTDLNETFGNNHHVILAGDLNSKHMAWNCDNTNKNENTLLQYCMDRALTIRAPTLPTHFPTRGSPSVLDIAVVKVCTLTDPYSLPQMTDHNPVVFKIRWATVVETPRRVFDFAATNWKQLDILLQHPPRISTEQDIDREVDTMTSAIQEAADATIPIRNVTGRDQVLPPAIVSLIQCRNQVRRKFQRTQFVTYGKGLKLLDRLTDSGLTKHRSERWQSFLRSLNPNNNNLWKMTRYFKKPRVQMPTLQHRGTEYYMAQDKADILATHFQTTHNLTLPQKITRHASQVEDAVLKFSQRKSNNFFVKGPINNSEVITNIQKPKPRTAPGEDGISNILIRKLNPKTTARLTYLFNCILRLGYFPTRWKQAHPCSGDSKTSQTATRPWIVPPLKSTINVKQIAGKICGKAPLQICREKHHHSKRTICLPQTPLNHCSIGETK